jgi:hypothetical protein
MSAIIYSVRTPTAERLAKERGELCEVEGCYNLGEEAHHVFYGRRRGKHAVPELDVDENFQLVCEDCHKYSGKATSYENRLQFWEKQCERYGRQHMVLWHLSLPIKVKHKYLD